MPSAFPTLEQWPAAVDNHHLSHRAVAGAGEEPLAGKVVSSEMPLLITKQGLQTSTKPSNCCVVEAVCCHAIHYFRLQ